ncbi:zinc finger protein [Porites harrisoni]
MVDGYLCRLWYRGQPLVCNLCAVQGHRSANCPNKDKCRKCGQSGHFARNCTSDGSAGDSADFPPLASSPQSAEANVSLDSSDSQLLKDNELDLMQSQSILQDLVPVSGESSGESNHRASKRAGKDKGSSAKRSNSTSNICFTNSQEFASLLANSELESNENAAVRNEQLNVAATSGRPLIEVIDEGQADLSSDEIESFGDSLSSSSLPPIFSEPPPDFADAMDESDSPPKDTSSPPPSVGSRYEGRSLCAKAKGSRGAASVRQSPLLKPLSGKHVLPQVVSSKPKGLRRSASLEELVL